MREILNLVDNLLFESRGLGARRSGEEFVSISNPNDKIYINQVTFYPEGRTMFDSYDELAQTLKSTLERMPGYSTGAIDLIGKFGPQDRAFGIAEFQRPDGQKLAWVKPFKKVNFDKTQNNWDNQTGIPGFKYNSKAAAKTQAGLTPQDILRSQQSDLSREDIVQQISQKFGEQSPLTLIAQAVAAGQPFPITIAAVEGIGFTAFRDYFCELLQPMALQTGRFTGSAGEAAKKFLGSAGFAGTTINFGNDKTEGLSDSILIAEDGRKVKVSSKGAAGAAASAKNLLDSVNELKDSNPALVKKYKSVIDIIEKIVSGGQAGAPLLLGVEYKIIDDSDVDVIRSFKNLRPEPIDQIDQVKCSAKLKKLFKTRGTNNPDQVNFYFHSIAAVAHSVADYINENTNFSEAASEILNNAALVQVYTVASESSGNWILEKFESEYPSQTTTGVKFNAGKTYYSTDIKGNFTFKILRNGAQDVNDDSTELKSMAKKPTAPVDIRPDVVKSKEKTADVGRSKR